MKEFTNDFKVSLSISDLIDVINVLLSVKKSIGSLTVSDKERKASIEYVLNILNSYSIYI